MKIQCSCGAKYSFEIQPDMVKTGVQFVCPSCGLDSSEHVTRLVWQQLAGAITPASAASNPPQPPAPPAPAPAPAAVPQIRIPSIPTSGGSSPVTPTVVRVKIPTPPSPPPAAPAIPQVHIPAPAVPAPALSSPAPTSSSSAPASQEAPSRVMVPPSAVNLRVHAAKPEASATASEEAEPELRCAKHAEVAEERCRICSKPICPKCMELFGYVCSPLCKAKADSHGIYVPEFAGQKSLVERRMWRRTAIIGGGIAAVIAGLLGFWFWYAWFGCAPRAVFAARFEDPAWSGQVKLATNGQVLVLHGDLLARYDIKTSKEMWSRHLVDKKAIAQEVAEDMKRAKKAIDKANNEDPDNAPHMPDAEKLQHSLEKSAAAALQLRVHGKSVWIASPGKLTRYDWDNGNPTKEIPLDDRYRNVIARGDELLLMNDSYTKRVITHVNMDTAEMRTEELKMAEPPAVASAAKGGKAKSATTTAKASAKKPAGTTTAGLPIGMPGKDAGKPLDPGKVAEQAQHLSLPAKIALPALLSGNASQERTLAELNGPAKPSEDLDDVELPSGMSVIPTKDGFVHFSVRLLESKIITRSAMKAAPAKSALEGNVTAGKSLEVANEILNDMQRSRGGDLVQEDESRYEVTLKQPGSTTPWKGEVIGRPSIFPLKTVTAVTGNKTVFVFDKQDKKLWQSTLTFKVHGSYAGLGLGMDDGEEEEGSRYGQGPLVEKDDTLYLYDEGVISAFDLKTGNARWRIPSVGVAGVFFDQAGMLYVNTTTASPDSIKYSRQIDISQKAISVVLKIDPKTGKTLWTAQPGGLVTHVLGNYIYCVQYYDPKKDEMEESPYSVETGFETPAYLRIKRLSAKNGKEVWEHFQQRGPLDVQFDNNTIELVFKKEVQVLKFLEL